jgi:hypothetical protein
VNDTDNPTPTKKPKVPRLFKDPSDQAIANELGYTRKEIEELRFDETEEAGHDGFEMLYVELDRTKLELKAAIYHVETLTGPENKNDRAYHFERMVRLTARRDYLEALISALQIARVRHRPVCPRDETADKVDALIDTLSPKAASNA